MVKNWENFNIDYYERDIFPDFFDYSINHTGIPSTWAGKSERYHEYAMAVFIKYLVEERKFNFKDMVEYVHGSNWYASQNPFIRLDEFLGGTEALPTYYKDYASWAVFSANSFLRNFKIVDFENTAVNRLKEIAEKKDVLKISPGKDMKLTINGGASGVSIDVFVRSDDQRLTTNDTPTPDHMFSLNGSQKTHYISGLKRNEVVYLLAHNTSDTPNQVNVTVEWDDEVDNKDQNKKIQHTFTLAGVSGESEAGGLIGHVAGGQIQNN